MSFTKKAGLGALRRLLNGELFLSVKENMRYASVGDWKNGRISSVRMNAPCSEAAVIVHELVEYLLCTFNGISAIDVDAEDRLVLDEKKKLGEVSYYKYHLVAEAIERLLISAFGVSWREHEDICAKADERLRKVHGNEIK